MYVHFMTAHMAIFGIIYTAYKFMSFNLVPKTLVGNAFAGQLKCHHGKNLAQRPGFVDC